MLNHKLQISNHKQTIPQSGIPQQAWLLSGTNPKLQITNIKFGYRLFGYCILFGICVLCIGISEVWALNLDTVKLYFFKGDYKACIQKGEKTLASAGKRDTKKDELHYYVGLSYLKEGNPLAASGNFKIILNEYKNSKFKDEAQLGLGDSYFMMGDYTLATVQYQDLINKNPKTKLKPGVYLRLSQLRAKTGNKEKENEYLAKLKKEFPFSPEAKMNEDLFPQNNIIRLSKDTVMENKTAPVDLSASYSVQIGAFSSNKNARNLVNKLQNKGYSAYVQDSSSQGKPIYKVRIGKLLNHRDAQALERKLNKLGYPTKIIP
jgi:tetratricopeptide (TPR) repeat protein